MLFLQTSCTDVNATLQSVKAVGNLCPGLGPLCRFDSASDYGCSHYSCMMQLWLRDDFSIISCFFFFIPGMLNCLCKSWV